MPASLTVRHALHLSPGKVMKVSISLFAFLFASAICLTGCGPTVSGQPAARTSGDLPLVQQPVCSVDESGKRTAFFVTISGGGSRAALFGARVLSELEHVDGEDLARHINVISSVSGGSLAAALYGISKDAGQGEAWRPVWDDNLINERLDANLRLSAAAKLANPAFLGSYIFGHQTRTDALFAALDSDVFDVSGEHGSLTLGDMNPTRPQIILNSTIATRDDSDAFRPRPFGSLFTFTKSNLGSIGVDYSSMPVSRAVAASAAFPGMMSPVVLNRFQRGSDETVAGIPKYIHLIDGGASDNLGLLAVKRALIEDSHRLLTQCDQVIVLTVDAFGIQGNHRDDSPDMRSPLGLVIDTNTLLSAFDSLLAVSRTRALAEFKSRMFVPPANSEQCHKEGLPDNICVGGVRANWEEINTLLKQKLFFVHLSFDSEEIAKPPSVEICKGNYDKGRSSDCNTSPINRNIYGQEVKALRTRLKLIPTTFGLPQDNVADISAFTKLLFWPENKCLMHLRDMLLRGVQHTDAFYENATNSCDETTSVTDEQMFRQRMLSGAIGDWILESGKKKWIKLPPEKPLTPEQREALWNETLFYYGWNGREYQQ